MSTYEHPFVLFRNLVCNRKIRNGINLTKKPRSNPGWWQCRRTTDNNSVVVFWSIPVHIVKNGDGIMGAFVCTFVHIMTYMVTPFGNTMLSSRKRITSTITNPITLYQNVVGKVDSYRFEPSASIRNISTGLWTSFPSKTNSKLVICSREAFNGFVWKACCLLSSTDKPRKPSKKN